MIHLPFAGGLDQRTDDRHSDPNKLLVAKNLRFDKNGRLVKRLGTEVLANTLGGDPISSGQGQVFAYRDEVAVIDGYRLGTYAAVKTSDLLDKDDVSEALVTRESFAHAGSDVDRPDIAVGNGVVLSVYELDSGVYATVYDQVTGAELYSTIQIDATGRKPRCCFVGNVGVICWVALAATDVKAMTFSSSYVFSAATTLFTDSTGNAIEITAMSDRFALAYQGPASVIKVRTYNAALVQQASVTGETTLAPAPLSTLLGLRGTTGETLWVAYQRTGDEVVRVIGLNPATLATTTAAFTVYTPPFTGEPLMALAIERLSSTTAVLCISGETTVTAPIFATFVACPVFNTSGTVLAAATNRRTYWSHLASKPFIVGSRAYAWLYSGGTNLVASRLGSYSCVLADIGADDLVTAQLPCRPIGVSAARFAGVTTGAGASVPSGDTSVSSVGLSGSQYVSLIKIKRDNAGARGVARALADFASTDRWMHETLGGVEHIAGGIVSYYDSTRVAECSYVYFPESVKLTGFNGSGSIANGTYNYRVTYETMDARGNAHRSAPSVLTSITLAGADDTVHVQIPCLCLTTRQDAESGFVPAVVITVYRTAAGSSSPFYRVGTINNDPKASTVTFDDLSSDASITGNTKLYTEGGVLDNVCPPSSSAIVSHQGRIWLIGDDGALWFSDVVTEGEAINFHDEFTIPVNDVGRPIGLASMDEKLVIFGASKIFWLTGIGPNIKGLEGDFGQPQPVSSDQTCVDQRSIVQYQNGILFQSPVDFYLLDRSLQVTNIGQPVTDELASFPSVTGAIVHPTEPHVHFLVDAGAEGSGARIVYDYRVNEWTTDEVIVGGSISTPISAAALNGRYYWLDDTGRLLRETTSYLDDDEYVSDQIRSTWFKPAGLQGYAKLHRLTLLLERFSSADVTVTLYRDYNTSDPIYTKTWAASTLDALDNLPIVQIVTHVSIPKCEALLFDLSTSSPTGGASAGTGRAYAMIGRSLEAEPMTDTFRLPSYQKG